MRRASSLLLLACVVWTGCSAIADEGQLLRLNLKQGDEIRYRINVGQEMAMDLGPIGQQNVSNTMSMDFRLGVDEVLPDGNYKMTATYESMSINVGVPGMQTITMNSTDAASPFAGMMGKPIGFIQTPRGEVVEVSGLSQLLADLFGQASDPGARQMMQMMQQSFSDDSFKDMMQQGMAIYPEQRVAIGDSWNGRFDMENPLGLLIMDYGYTATAVEDCAAGPCLKTAFTIGIKMDGPGPMVEQLEQMIRAQGAEIELDWKLDDSEGQGDLWIDLDTGTVVKMDMTQQLGMAIAISGTLENEQRDMNMKIDINQSIRMERVD